LYERVIFGPWQTAFLSGVNLVIWAPIFEEIGFRGLLYTTIRSRFTPWVAIIVSALIFSSLHLYSLPGFLAVFWSGLVLAYAYERYRSLLPCIIVHALGNLLTMSTVLLFYR
jgi:membrane protease YdiL (CAAX protease family)